ncbi:MAG: hypothetical protein Q9164_003078, partial [Protoblastenia rupestris]
ALEADSDPRPSLFGPAPLVFVAILVSGAALELESDLEPKPLKVSVVDLFSENRPAPFVFVVFAPSLFEIEFCDGPGEDDPGDDCPVDGLPATELVEA